MDRIKSAESATPIPESLCPEANALKSTRSSWSRVAGKKGFSLITDGKSRELYALLLQCKMLDERLRSIPAYECWPGREASTASVAACLRRGDSVTRTPRGVLGGFLQYGTIDLKADAADDPIRHLAAATGEALRLKLEKRGQVAVVYATMGEQENAREIFASAARLALPVVYVVEGGQSAEKSCGAVPVIRVDGGDAVAVYRVAYESTTRAREGSGPTMIECAEWPLEEKAVDPLAKLEQYLTGKRLFRKAWKKQLEKRYCSSLDAAVGALAGS